MRPTLNKLYLPYLILRRRILLLFALVFLGALFSGGFAAAGLEKMKEGTYPPVQLGLVSRVENKTVGIILDQLVRSPDLFSHVTLVRLDSTDEAFHQVQSGELSGAIVLPSDFHEWINGRGDAAPTLIVKNPSSMEYAVLKTIGDGLLVMLADAQRGVSLAIQAFEIVRPVGISYDTVWMGANMAFLNIAFNYGDRFEEKVVSGPSSLSYSVHVMLCLCFSFCLLLTPVLQDKLSLSAQASWLRRLGSIGVSPWRYGLGQIVVSMVGYFFILLFVTGFLVSVLFFQGEALVLSPLLLLSLCLSSLFLAAFTFFFGNLGGPVLGGILSCGISISSLILAGGLIPKVLLPLGMQKLSFCSPILWLRDLFAASFLKTAPEPLIPLVALLALTGCLLLGCYCLCRRFGRWQG